MIIGFVTMCTDIFYCGKLCFACSRKMTCWIFDYYSYHYFSILYIMFSGSISFFIVYQMFTMCPNCVLYHGR